jgi:N-methylhydantoinase B
VRNSGTDREEILHSKASGLVLDAGETIRVETLGGGSNGSPRERSAANLASDLRQGKVSRAAAERDYGAQKVEEALKLVRS